MKAFIKNLLLEFGLLGKAMHFYGLVKSLRLGALLGNTHYSLRAGPDGLPIPPLPLRFTVSGDISIARFLEVGRLGADSIRTSLEFYGLDMKDFQTILDFGCGCGRVIRHWNSLQSTQIFGTDYNPQLINWCRNHLPFAQFQNNQLAPPLDFESGKFDFIYALSVVTHMGERLQLDWMQEILRILKPGGYFLFSTHGSHYLHELKCEEQERFRAGQLVVQNQSIGGTNFCGSYHPRSYVEGTLSRGFQIVGFFAKGAKGNPHQDLYIFRAPAPNAAAATAPKLPQTGAQAELARPLDTAA